MISLVNGYVCHNCSEVALAKQGKDPNAKPGEPQDGSHKTGGISAFGDRPATIFGGSLKGLLSANPVTAATAADPTQMNGQLPPASAVDITV
jgi:hypothetical protein